MIRRALVALVSITGLAHAKPVLVALTAPAGDARAAIAIGPGGEAFEPDPQLRVWTRHAGGGIADEVVAATSADASALAIVKTGAVFELVRGGWSVMNLGLHAKVILGRGPRAVAAVGKTVFGLAGGKPAKLADADAPVLAVAASGKAIVVETDRGLARLDGAKWTALAKAPRRVEQLLDSRWAEVEHGVVELATGKVTTWPAGFRPQAIEMTGDGVIVAATSHELVMIKAAVATREVIGVALASPVVGVVADRAGRVVVATRSGQLAVRTHGTWTAGELRAELPPARNGSPPAQQAQ